MLHGLPLAYNTDLREDKRYLFDAVDCLDCCCRSYTGCSRRSVRQARMAAACDSFLAATDVADDLVAKGMPFREAHHVTGALVRRCLERAASAAGRELALPARGELGGCSPRASLAHGPAPRSLRARLAQPVRADAAGGRRRRP